MKQSTVEWHWCFCHTGYKLACHAAVALTYTGLAKSALIKFLVAQDLQVQVSAQLTLARLHSTSEHEQGNSPVTAERECSPRH